MKNNDLSVLQKMIGYCNDIELLLNKYNKNFNTYLNDISFQYSCNMCIIQLGELVGRLSDNIIDNNNQIPWHAIKSMRNLHAHDYENVDLSIVWNTLTEEIPLLKSELQKLI